MTLRSGLSAEGMIGSETAGSERSVWEETGGCSVHVCVQGGPYFFVQLQVVFRRVRRA